MTKSPVTGGYKNTIKKGAEDTISTPLITDLKWSGRLDNCTGADATGTDTNTCSTSAIGYHPNFLQIRQPPSPVFIMGMADIISRRRSFSTYFTYTSHNIFSLQGVYSLNRIFLLLPPKKSKFFSSKSGNKARTGETAARHVEHYPFTALCYPLIKRRKYRKAGIFLKRSLTYKYYKEEKI